jgi:hypothetical protein
LGTCAHTSTVNESLVVVMIAAEHDDGDIRHHVRRLVAGHVSWHARHHTVARVCQYELPALEPEHFGEILELRHGADSPETVLGESYAELAARRLAFPSPCREGKLLPG